MSSKSKDTAPPRRLAASTAGGASSGTASPAGGSGLSASDSPAGGVAGGGGVGSAIAVGGAGRYRDRDRKLLHFLRVYRLAIYQVVSLLFWGGFGKSCGHVAKRLNVAGLIEIHKRGLPGGVTWLSLTTKGARQAGLRDQPQLSGSAIEDNLQTLLFCTLSESGNRRYRLQHDEVKKVYPKGAFPSNVHVVLTEEFGEPLLLRCFHARGKVKSTVTGLHSLVEALSGKPGIEQELRLGHVGIAVLCPTAEIRDALRKEVKASTLSDYRVVIEWAPDSGHLAGFLKKQKAGAK